jgi:DNA-binding beta-propeller fold protein YncE
MKLFSIDAGQARVRLVQGGAVFVAAVLAAGCGSAYRSVVTPISTSGPPAQPTAYAVVVSAPSPTTPGVATIVDYSGDSVMAFAPIGPGPVTFTIDGTGSNGYTVNSDGTLSNFPISTSLQAKNVTYTTLPSTALPVNLYAPSAGLYAADLYGNVADVFSGFPQSFKLAIPVGVTPVSIMGPPSGGQRVFALTQGDVTSPTACNISPATAGLNGVVNSIELSTYTVSSSIVLDPYNPTNSAAGTTNAVCPVFAVESPDNKRLFVLNRGSDTVSVINAQDNTLDQCTPFVNQNGQTVSCHPILPLSLGAVNSIGAAYKAAGSPANGASGVPPNGTAGMTQIAGPVYAEYNAATAQLIVANYDGGTISVIDVSEDEYGNDSPTFGTTFTIAVGNNPAAVTVLADGSRAYTANQTDQSVTVVLLNTHTVEKTLPVTGHPRTVVSTQNSEYGKVYVAAPDTPYLTIISTGGTDPDIVDTTVLVEGNIVDVRTTNQNGSSGNANVQSRTPGYGQPCYLPPAAEVATYGANYTLANCRTLP